MAPKSEKEIFETEYDVLFNEVDTLKVTPNGVKIEEIENEE
ncbi:hypothetical protein [Spiroplasma endosymbiont of Aspidapion aeneum]